MYKKIRVAVKGSVLFDSYAMNGHDNQYYSVWVVNVRLCNFTGNIEKICGIDLIETYATPTFRQLSNAEKLFNNGFMEVFKK